MTVIEVIKKYGLEDYDKYYKDCINYSCDTKYRIEELAKKDVKSIYINFPNNEVTITIIP